MMLKVTESIYRIHKNHKDISGELTSAGFYGQGPFSYKGVFGVIPSVVDLRKIDWYKHIPNKIDLRKK